MPFPEHVWEMRESPINQEKMISDLLWQLDMPKAMGPDVPPQTSQGTCEKDLPNHSQSPSSPV